MGINPPLYTLEQLAEMIGVSLDTLRRVARAYPSYFIKIAGRTIIRASRS
jgi:NADH:ubiquinone oxidoreductase subunit E